ncbi:MULTISPECIES: transposase [unclassified Bradyrhizobium]
MVSRKLSPYRCAFDHRHSRQILVARLDSCGNARNPKLSPGIWCSTVASIKRGEQTAGRDPGVGPALATALVASIADPKASRSGRDSLAWVGLALRRER